MTGPSYDTNREDTTNKRTKALFTIDEAEKMLPLLRPIVQDIVDAFKPLRETGKQRRKLENFVHGSELSPASKKMITALNKKINNLDLKINGYQSELTKLGVKLHDIALGVIYFPTFIKGNPAYLSWGLGEDNISWWVPEGEIYESRKPVKF